MMLRTNVGQDNHDCLRIDTGNAQMSTHDQRRIYKAICHISISDSKNNKPILVANKTR